MPEFILNANHRGTHPYYALSTFAKGYVEAAFFTNCDTGNQKREDHANELGVERLTHASVDAIARDCAAFLATPVGSKGKTIADAITLADAAAGYGEGRAGNDFWFTRQGHGVGYADRDIRAPLATILTKAAESFGEAHTDIYRGWILFYSDEPAIEKLPVVFKMEGRGRDKTPVAIFPTLPGTNEYDCTCYAHIGQHSSCDIGYAASLKPAKPAEYADLLRELRWIYSNAADNPVELVIKRKVGTSAYLEARKAAMKR